ncbi:MAG: DUF1883 domain-containing protein [Spirochaetia bacterium]|nr:DUF1883 domain-containing protein [Spirochaetia bacterium]
MKYHLHKIINFDLGDTIKIDFNGSAFVAFMDDENYERYIGDFEYDFFGKEVSESSFSIVPPNEGRWHLVIEHTKIPADMEVHVQIVSEL